MIFIKGLIFVNKEGFLYLGICGFNCMDFWVLDKDVDVVWCFGICVYVFGF